MYCFSSLGELLARARACGVPQVILTAEEKQKRQRWLLSVAKKRRHGIHTLDADDDGPDVVISRALGEAMEERLARGEQAMVLLNRRGYARALICRQCAATLECPNCSLSLTVHRAASRARCHYCNYSTPLPNVCVSCGGQYIELVGFGTERVEADVREDG